MDIGGSAGGPKSDINVTPLVDVMLVLLIIMMLVAPMLQKGVDVKLPAATNTSDKPETQQQTVLAVDARDKFYLNGIEVPRAEMADCVTRALEEDGAGRPHQGRHGRVLPRHHDGDGRPAEGRHRGHRAHHRPEGREPECTAAGDGRKVGHGTRTQPLRRGEGRQGRDPATPWST